MFGIALDFVYLVIMLAIVFGSWAIYLSVAGTSGMIKLFSKRIPIVNGIFCAMLFIMIGLFGYMDEVPWNNPLHPVFTILIGIGIYILCHYIQKTKIGFWLFAVIMSPFWAAIGSCILTLITKSNMIVFWIGFGILTIFNVYLHIRSRKYALNICDPDIADTQTQQVQTYPTMPDQYLAQAQGALAERQSMIAKMRANGMSDEDIQRYLQ